MRLSRRALLKQAAVSSGALILPQTMWAQSDVTIGDMVLTTLSDGTLRLPTEMIVGDAPMDEAQAVLNAYGLNGAFLEPECNVTLLRQGSRTILFDAGAGANFMPSAGKLMDALSAADVDPFDVTDVVFTHAHPDHLWGLLDDFDDLSFPNADYYMGAAEWAYWTDPDTVSTIGEARTAFAVGAQSRLALLADRITLVADGDDIAPGVRAVATFGHTPGHLAFAVSQGDEMAMILGDCIANHHIAFEHPAWPSGTDQDPERGAATRAQLMDQLATDRITVLGFHLPGGGIGQVERRGDAYHFASET